MPCTAIPKAKFEFDLWLCHEFALAQTLTMTSKQTLRAILKQRAKIYALSKGFASKSHLFQKLSHYRAFNAPKIHAYLALVRAHNSPYAKDFMLYQIALFKRLVCALCQACF